MAINTTGAKTWKPKKGGSLLSHRATFPVTVESAKPVTSDRGSKQIELNVTVQASDENNGKRFRKWLTYENDQGEAYVSEFFAMLTSIGMSVEEINGLGESLDEAEVCTDLVGKTAYLYFDVKEKNGKFFSAPTYWRTETEFQKAETTNENRLALPEGAQSQYDAA